MQSKIIFLIFALILLGAGCFSKQQKEEQVAPVLDRDAILQEARENGLIMSDEEIVRMSSLIPVVPESSQMITDVESYLQEQMKGWSSAALADVTGGESYGLAHAQSLNDESLLLVVELGNLPDPGENFMYEGWLVARGEDMKIVSTGEAVKTEKGYANVFKTSGDLSQYNFYVLTLEVKDGNSSPGDHILEGGFRN